MAPHTGLKHRSSSVASNSSQLSLVSDSEPVMSYSAPNPMQVHAEAVMRMIHRLQNEARASVMIQTDLTMPPLAPAANMASMAGYPAAVHPGMALGEVRVKPCLSQEDMAPVVHDGAMSRHSSVTSGLNTPEPGRFTPTQPPHVEGDATPILGVNYNGVMIKPCLSMNDVPEAPGSYPVEHAPLAQTVMAVGPEPTVEPMESDADHALVVEDAGAEMRDPRMVPAAEETQDPLAPSYEQITPVVSEDEVHGVRAATVYDDVRGGLTTIPETPTEARAISPLEAYVHAHSPVSSASAASIHEEDEEEEEEADLPGPVAGRVKKRTRRTRLTMPKTSRGKRYRKGVMEKMLREDATGEHFPLSHLEWSDWRRAIQRKMPTDRKWERRLADHTGARRRVPFENMANPAVYEFAVKVPGHQEKIPVMSTVTKGLQGGSWEANLLSKDKVRSQVDRVLKRGCKVYVRQAPFSVRQMASVYDKCKIKRKADAARSTADAVHELRGLMARVCDYAWRDHYDTDSRTYSHRSLVVNGVKVSD